VQGVWRGGSGESKNIMGGKRSFPEVLFRPPLLGDEKEPRFSNCTLPFIFYKAHDDNFRHTTISTLPQMYSFFSAGAINRDVTFVVCSALVSPFECQPVLPSLPLPPPLPRGALSSLLPLSPPFCPPPRGSPPYLSVLKTDFECFRTSRFTPLQQ
jgi:hypothetical protein